MDWSIKSILDKFRGRSEQPASETAPLNSNTHVEETNTIAAMETSELIEAMALRGDKIRPALGISEDEPESKAWRDVTGTGHLYIRGALQSLERISKNEHDAEAAGTAEGTINFAAKSPDGFFGSTAGQSAIIAQKILASEQSGVSDLSQIITEADMTTLMVGLKDANETIAYIASEEDAANDVKLYANAFDKAAEHYTAFSFYMKQKLETGMDSRPDDFS